MNYLHVQVVSPQWPRVQCFNFKNRCHAGLTMKFSVCKSMQPKHSSIQKGKGGKYFSLILEIVYKCEECHCFCSGYLSHALPRVRKISLAAIPLMFFLNNQCKHLGKIGHSNLQSKSSTSSFLPPSLSSMWVLTAISMG